MEEVTLKQLYTYSDSKKNTSQFEIDLSVRQIKNSGKNGWLQKLIDSHTFRMKSKPNTTLIVLNPNELALQITEFYQKFRGVLFIIRTTKWNRYEIVLKFRFTGLYIQNMFA